MTLALSRDASSGKRQYNQYIVGANVRQQRHPYQQHDFAQVEMSDGHNCQRLLLV